MKIKNVLLVFGTRPEAIKMAPIYRELKDRLGGSGVRVCVTAQHREMLDQVLSFFEISPDYDLDIMTQGQDLCDVASKVITGLKEVIQDFKPDLILVHGDTCTSTAAALAAFYLGVDVGHVEAGLRTFDLDAPWPEEAQRQMTAVISKFNFAPTVASKENLILERRNNIWVTGNSVIDALKFAVNKINQDPGIVTRVSQSLGVDYTVNNKRKMILVTGHRRENFGSGFLNICEALRILASNNPNVDIIYPVHLNPNVREPVTQLLNRIPNVYLVEPQPYEVFVYLMDNCYFILSDSGGVQEEAPSLGKPVLVMRDTTERPEAIAAGTAKLVGTSKENIIAASQSLLDDHDLYLKISKIHNPFGDGRTAKKIADTILAIDIK